MTVSMDGLWNRAVNGCTGIESDQVHTPGMLRCLKGDQKGLPVVASEKEIEWTWIERRSRENFSPSVLHCSY